jgi:hypothetical protein
MVGAFAELKAEYDSSLARMEQAVVERHLQGPAKAMHAWRQELEEAECNSLICKHAQRTIRSLGGMESIGEIASTSDDHELLALVEALSQTCIKISSCCCL